MLTFFDDLTNANRLAIGQEIGRLKLFARGKEDIGVIAAVFLVIKFNISVPFSSVIIQPLYVIKTNKSSIIFL
jgi:hypothetical protein